MSGSRHQRTPVNHPPRKLIAGLIILAVGCVAAAAFAVFAPKRAARLPPPAQALDQTQPSPVTSHQEKPFLPRFQVSLSAAPDHTTKPTTTDVRSGTTTTADVVPATTKPQATSERISDEPRIPDVTTAREFAALFQALVSDDYLAVHIALNDFTTMPDACEPLIRHLTKAWTERHVILTTAVGTLKTPLTIRDPLTPQPAKILAANRDGLTLAMGTGSHQVPWTTWNRKEVARMWSELAELQGYRDDSATIAALANWLTEDLVTARAIAKKLDHVRTTPANDDGSMTTLSWSIERWLAISWWETGNQARQQGNHDLLNQMAKRLKSMERMSNPRIDAETAATVFGLSSPDQPLAAPVVKQTPVDALQALPGFPGVMSSGKWSVVPTGARCAGDGALVLGDLGGCERLEITFTPRRFQGTLLIVLKPYEWLVDFDQSTMAMKGPRGFSSPVPVTLFPRHPNVVRMLFKGQGTGSVAVNRDPAFAEFTLRQPPDQLRLTVPTGGDVVINALTRVP